MCEKEALELVVGVVATTEEEKSQKNCALDDVVTPISYTSRDPSLRILVMSENKSPIV